MKSGELKIYYRRESVEGILPINMELDQALEDTLKKFGFRHWASSVNMINGVRDLAFEKKRIKNK